MYFQMSLQFVKSTLGMNETWYVWQCEENFKNIMWCVM